MTEEATGRLLFGIGPNGDETVTLVIGVTKQCWREMHNGNGKDIDLTRAGLPIKVIVFGCETRESGSAFLNEIMGKMGVPVHDIGAENGPGTKQ